jgi:hypothetical protein
MRHIKGSALGRTALGLTIASIAVVLGGCVTPPPPHDYSAFQKAKPASLLVLPPVNETPDIKATPGVWAHATRPLSEAGYYVLPVTLVDETLKANGIQTAVDAQEIPYQKLREVFGADAGVYIKVTRYGTSYKVVDSETRVDVQGRVIDLRSGDLLWSGQAFATSAEQSQQSQGGLVGLLVTAVVKQIIGTATDAAYVQAGTAQARLLGAPRYNGILPGPRSPVAGQVTAPPK